MYVPRAWAREQRRLETAEGERALVAWGWGADEAEARRAAAERMQRLVERWRGATGATDEYGYGSRPLREEILQELGPQAVLTRNRQGAVVLNAARLLFLDVDLSLRGGLSFLERLFGVRDALAKAVERLGAALRAAAPQSTFRVYRTAAGLRALAVDREFDPRGEETQALMQRTGTDPAFAQLCRAQGSFRARLTPKPWRCACPRPPGEHPRDEARARAEFAGWCKRYERAIERHATCRLLETVGAAPAAAQLAPLVELHDRATRCGESLPLA